MDMIFKGKEFYNQHINNYEQMKKGFEVFVAGLREFSDYARKETSPLIMAQVNEMLEKEFREGEGMKNYLKQLNAKN